MNESWEDRPTVSDGTAGPGAGDGPGERGEEERPRSWVRQVPPDEAEGTLADVYRRLGYRGRVDHIVGVHSLHPEVMEAHIQLYRSVMFGASPLSRQDRESIAVVVSAANDCFYCVQHHGAAVRKIGGEEDEGLADRLARDWRSAGVRDELEPLLAYAEKLTVRPDDVREEDLEELRGAGWSDEAILHTCEIVAYFNFVNRMAIGLGVSLEPGWPYPLLGYGGREGGEGEG